MKNNITDKPLYSLTIGEYIELLKSLLKDLHQSQTKEYPASKELLTIVEAAEFLHMSVATLYTLNCKRRIPFIKVSGKVFYKRSSLLDWLDSGERKTKTQLRNEIEEDE
jgi:predicted DNA-binding transcriptional regulator AlpA